jgi:aryl-phospho-beta-D-glucosidase BglC (GH1 family)
LAAFAAVACSGGDEAKPPAPTELTTPTSEGGEGTTPTVPGTAPGEPAPARPGTGEFEVDGADIFDPDGQPFVPMGTNMNGPNSFFDVPTKGKSELIAEGWGFNAVRLVTCFSSGCQNATSTVNNDLAGIVDEYTGRKVVVMIELHQFDIGGHATAEDVQAAAAFWRDIANTYKSNPYVWFNLFNEPEASYHDYTIGSTAPVRWRAQHQPVIDAIRATGATNLIVVDETQAGQGAADWWEINESPAEDSGIMSEGRNLQDPVGRLAFSVHAYDVWGFPNGNDPSCATRYSDEQRDARFRSYVQRIVSQGLPLIVGELGFAATDSPTTGTGAHAFGNHPPCGSTNLLSAETVYRVAPEFRLGVLVWHGFDLTTEGPQDWSLVGGDNPTNLTHLGRMQYAYTKAILGG